MHDTRRVRRIAATLLLAGATIAAACQNPVSGRHEEEVHGVSIRDGDVEVARYFEEEVTGELPAVAAGELGPVLSVVFLDHDGAPLDHSGEHDVYLRARSGNASIASFEVTGFGGRVQGNAAGSTTIFFDLMHGEPPSGGHPDFSTAGIPVTILP